MNAEPTPPSGAEVADELTKWAVGLGIITFALFPLSLPFLILTGVALLPFLLPLIAAGLLTLIATVPVLLVRGLARRLGRRRGAGRPRGADEVRSPAYLEATRL